jgi:hypothetical protein
MLFVSGSYQNYQNGVVSNQLTREKVRGGESAFGSANLSNDVSLQKSAIL